MDKKLILQKIYDNFQTWSENIPTVCAKGCSTCCTQNVTVTATEADRILQFAKKNNREAWLVDKLKNGCDATSPALSTNGYASACMEEQEVEPEQPATTTACPFLEDSCCSIYEVRPFNCRCFCSEVKCSQEQPAAVPDYYLTGATAVHQLIEHMDQGDYWGNLIDVLLARCGSFDYTVIGNLLHGTDLIDNAKKNIHWAKPLPGFLIMEEDQEKVSPLLEAIFTTKIDHRTIEEIFNGKQ